MIVGEAVGEGVGKIIGTLSGSLGAPSETIIRSAEDRTVTRREEGERGGGIYIH